MASLLILVGNIQTSSLDVCIYRSFSEFLTRQRPSINDTYFTVCGPYFIFYIYFILTDMVTVTYYGLECL